MMFDYYVGIKMKKRISAKSAEYSVRVTSDGDAFEDLQVNAPFKTPHSRPTGWVSTHGIHDVRVRLMLNTLFGRISVIKASLLEMAVNQGEFDENEFLALCGCLDEVGGWCDRLNELKSIPDNFTTMKRLEFLSRSSALRAEKKQLAFMQQFGFDTVNREKE